MGEVQKTKYARFKSMLNNHYESIEKASSRKRVLKYLSVLFFPFLTLTVLYFIFRWGDVKKANILFWICILSACIWFIFGPVLVQRFTREFKSFQTDNYLPKNTRDYFKGQSDRHLTIFIRYRIIESIVFIIIAIIPILLYPEILSKNVTNGIGDLFFWLIIAFLVWFLCYCVNATAYISLIAFHIISDIQKDGIVSYNPVIESHRYAINKIKKFCGKAVRYVCSGLVFIPLAVYYIYQQPELVINSKKMLQILPASSQHPIYLFWVVSLLLFYSFFLLFFMTFQYAKIHRYIKKKNSAFLLDAQINFVSHEDKNRSVVQSAPSFVVAAYKYTEYLKLQEIRLLCKTDPFLDINVVVTYFSVVVSVLSAIQGIQQIIKWTPS